METTNTYPRLLYLLLLSSVVCTAQRGDTISCDTRDCGAFESCNSQDSPICTCLPGYIPQQSDDRNFSTGCQRRLPLSCNNGTKPDGFLTLRMIKLADYSSRWYAREDECEGACLRNCSCIAYGYDTGIGCLFWSGTLINLQKVPTGSGVVADLFIRVANSELEHNNKDSKKITVIVVVVCLVITCISSFVIWKLTAKRRALGQTKSEPPTLEPTSSAEQDTLAQFNLEELPLFKFEILANATDNFCEDNKLGKGGFGPVYKGKLENGKEIAIKRLSKASGQGIQEFKNEVMLISKLQHRNLVRLLGCCVENKETMLVYEYMPNKSLNYHLFDPSKKKLDWRTRYNIIEGICRGLLYLHRDSRLKIIHRDLKPSNILLDDDWNPKISDFGMARIYGTKQEHVSTVRVVGTYGYMAPEYAMDGRFSEKSDVFSFGVLMLEIATGKRNSSFFIQDSTMNLLGHVWKQWCEGDVGSLMDPRDSSASQSLEFVRCIHIGLLCVQEHPKDRPSISAVLSMLRSEIMELPTPKQLAFTTNSRSNTSTSSSQWSQTGTSTSVNHVTISVVDAR